MSAKCFDPGYFCENTKDTHNGFLQKVWLRDPPESDLFDDKDDNQEAWGRQTKKRNVISWRYLWLFEDICDFLNIFEYSWWYLWSSEDISRSCHYCQHFILVSPYNFFEIFMCAQANYYPFLREPPENVGTWYLQADLKGFPQFHCLKSGNTFQGSSDFLNFESGSCLTYLHSTDVWPTSIVQMFDLPP